MNELINFGLLCFTSFFTLINPISTMPIFMTMTADMSDRERRKTAQKAVIVAFFTLILFAFTGQILFKFFGISINSLRVVGGIIFFSMGYDMLQAKLVRTQIDKHYKKEYINDISVTPLAIPMICGPGAITNAIVLMEDSPVIEKKAMLLLSIFVALIVTFLILLSSNKLIRLIGDTGNKIMMRLMGMIVMVIAVEFFFSGLKPILISILKEVPKHY